MSVASKGLADELLEHLDFGRPWVDHDGRTTRYYIPISKLILNLGNFDPLERRANTSPWTAMALIIAASAAAQALIQDIVVAALTFKFSILDLVAQEHAAPSSAFQQGISHISSKVSKAQPACMVPATHQLI